MRPAIAAALLAAAAELAACTSPDPAYYTLQPVPGPAVPSAVGSVELRRPGLAGYLDRSDIVLKTAGYQLNVNSQLRWGEPLGDMIGRVLVQDLSQRLPQASVFAESGAITAEPQLRVEVDVLRFDADASGAVVLDAQLAVERGGGAHQPLSARRFSMIAPPGGAGAANLVASMSGLLGGLADQVARDLGAAGLQARGVMRQHASHDAAGPRWGLKTQAPNSQGMVGSGDIT